MLTRLNVCQVLTAGLILFFTATSAFGASITTTFADNNGYAGNMFDINVLNAGGVSIDALDLNLDNGTWNIEVYSIASAYSGFETNSAAWTLRDTVAGLVSSGRGVATNWDFTDFALGGSATSALYVSVTNGNGLNYTNGSVEGAVYAADGYLEILEGIGNAPNFGTQYRPRVFNGSVHYTPVPEPGSAILMGLGLLGLASVGHRPRA